MKKILAVILAMILCAMPVAMATEQIQTNAINSVNLTYENITSFADFQELFFIAMYIDLSNRWTMENLEAGICEDANILREALNSNSIYMGYYDLGSSWSVVVYCFGEEKTLMFSYSSNGMLGSTLDILDRVVLPEERKAFMEEQEIFSGYNPVDANRVLATMETMMAS